MQWNNFRKFFFQQGGISLVELLIVVSILGVVAMLAYPKMKLSMEDSRLSAATAEVAAAMEYARLKAVNAGLPARVEINASTENINVEQFELPQEISEDVPSIDESIVEAGSFEKMDHPLNPGAPYRLSLGGDGLFGGIDVVSAVFGGSSTVTFDTLGAPSDGGTVTLACGGYLRMIHVDGLTGKVTVTN